MKSLITLSFVFSLLFSADAKKDVDFNDLFSQLDKVISSKKDKGKVDKDKSDYRKESTSVRENKYRKFNEAAKKYHIFRANKILITVKKLIKEYEISSKSVVKVRRYSNIGNKIFAYVSSSELNSVISKLSVKGKRLKKLYNFNNLLKDIGNYDIKTIAKILIIVEQEIMNIMGMGIKKFTLKEKKSNINEPIRVNLHKIFKSDIEVIKINKDIVTLKFITA